MNIKNISAKKIVAAALLGAFAVGSSFTVWSAEPSSVSAGRHHSETVADGADCQNGGRYNDNGQAGCRGGRGERRGPGRMGNRWNNAEVTPQAMAENMAKTFGLDAGEILAAHEANCHHRDIMHAAFVAKACGQPFAHVIKLKTADNSWRDVEAMMRVSPEMMRGVWNDIVTDRLVDRLNLERKTVKGLIDDGYKAYDISFAAVIAKLSNSDVKAVLKERKINNTWRDVAKAHKVDERKMAQEIRELCGPGMGFMGAGGRGQQGEHRPMPLPLEEE